MLPLDGQGLCHGCSVQTCAVEARREIRAEKNRRCTAAIRIIVPASAEHGFCAVIYHVLPLDMVHPPTRGGRFLEPWHIL